MLSFAVGGSITVDVSDCKVILAACSAGFVILGLGLGLGLGGFCREVGKSE